MFWLAVAFAACVFTGCSDDGGGSGNGGTVGNNNNNIVGIWQGQCDWGETYEVVFNSDYTGILWENDGDGIYPNMFTWSVAGTTIHVVFRDGWRANFHFNGNRFVFEEITFTTRTDSVNQNLPSAPTNVSATATSSGINITWNAISGARAYIIYYSRNSANSFTEANYIVVNSNSFFDDRPSSDETWHYRITAVNNRGEGNHSATINATVSSLFISPANGVNEAWVSPDGSAAFVFRQNGSVEFLGRFNNIWQITHTGSWTNGSNAFEVEGTPITFAIQGNTLTTTFVISGDVFVFTRTSNVIIGGGNNSIVGTWDLQINICNGSTMIFNPNGTGTWTFISDCITSVHSFTWSQTGNTVRVFVGSQEFTNFQFTGGNTIMVDGLPFTRVNAVRSNRTIETLFATILLSKSICSPAETLVENVRQTFKKITNL